MSSDPDPTILTIPSELLLSVLEYLPYIDLKKSVPLVCRTFHALVQKSSPEFSTPIDVTLWRDAPSAANRNAPGTRQTTLHPLLHHDNYQKGRVWITYRFSKEIDDVLVVKNDDYEENNNNQQTEQNEQNEGEGEEGEGDGEGEAEEGIFDTLPSGEKIRLPPDFTDDPSYTIPEPDVPISSHNLRHENACNPAAGRAEYHRVRFDGREPGSGVAITATGDGGRVTIMDVMNAVVGAKKDGRWSGKGDEWGGFYWDGVARADVKDGVLHLYDEPHFSGR